MFIKSQVEELFEMDKKKLIEDWKKQNPIKAIIEEDGVVWRMYSQTSLKDVADHEASQIRDVGFRARIKGPFKDGKYAWVVYAGPKKVFNYDNRVIKLRNKLSRIPKSYQSRGSVLAWVNNADKLERIFSDRTLQKHFEKEGIEDEDLSDKRDFMKKNFGKEVSKWWYELAKAEHSMASYIEEAFGGYCEEMLSEGRLGEAFNEEAVDECFSDPEWDQ